MVRPDERPWWDRIPQILGYPASVSGILLCVFLGFLSWMGAAVARFGFVSFTGGFAIVGLVFSTLFVVIRESADGRTAIPDLGHVKNLREDVIFPGVKASVLGVLLFLPAIAILIGGIGDPHPAASSTTGAAQVQAQLAHAGLPIPEAVSIPTSLEDAEPRSSAETPRDISAGELPAPRRASNRTPRIALLVLAIVIGASLYPLCLLILAMSGSLVSAINPVVWAQILGEVFAPYLGLVAGLGILNGAAAAISAPLLLVSSAIPFAPSILARSVQIYFALCSAHLLGWFVFQYRDRLGHTPDVREEMDVDRVRRIKEATLAEIARTRPIVEPGLRVGANAGGIGVGASAATTPDSRPPSADEVAGLGARFSVACAEGDLVSASASAPLLVDAYWQAGDVESPPRLYARLLALDPDFSFDAPRQARLARAIEDAGDAPAAAGAWRALALKHPDHKQAPRALYRCAECHAKSGQSEWARKALQILLDRYPADETAPLAKSRLKSL